MDDVFHLRKGEPTGYRLVHDAGRRLRIERVVVDVQVDLVDPAGQPVQLGDDVALWPSLLPGDGTDGGALQPAGSAGGERLRTPASTTSCSGTGGRPPSDARRSRQQWPVTTASDMPGKKPLAEEAGALKSACASIQTMPQRPPPRPATTPMAASQDPASTIGSRAAPSAACTARRTP
jgi:hypothetical protein